MTCWSVIANPLCWCIHWKVFSLNITQVYHTQDWGFGHTVGVCRQSWIFIPQVRVCLDMGDVWASLSYYSPLAFHSSHKIMCQPHPPMSLTHPGLSIHLSFLSAPLAVLEWQQSVFLSNTFANAFSLSHPTCFHVFFPNQGTHYGDVQLGFCMHAYILTGVPDLSKTFETR